MKDYDPGFALSPAEKRIAAEFGLNAATSFALKEGHTLPENDVEFGGMLAIAFAMGRESLQGDNPDPLQRIQALQMQIVMICAGAQMDANLYIVAGKSQ